MCTSAPGFHTTTRELQTRTSEGPGASNTTKIPREDPPVREKERKWERERGKKAGNVGPPRLRALALRAPTLRAGTIPAPTRRGPRIRAPTLRAEALQAPHFFWVWAPLRSSFLSHFSSFLFFCAFFIVSISCHFFEFVTVCVFLVFLHIFQNL